MMRRRRPLAAAAMVGGASYLGARAGQRSAQNQYDQQAYEADQSQRIAQLEAQQQQQAYQQAPPPPPAAAPAAPASDLTSKIMELKGLMDQGILTQDEFNAGKAKLLAEG
jgi:Short C-terminal domain